MLDGRAVVSAAPLASLFGIASLESVTGLVAGEKEVRDVAGEYGNKQAAIDVPLFEVRSLRG